MSSAIDANSHATATAILITDGATITRLEADASTGALGVTTSTTGEVSAGAYAYTDENGRPTLYAVSSSDGITPVPLRCDSNGNLLIKLI